MRYTHSRLSDDGNPENCARFNATPKTKFLYLTPGRIDPKYNCQLFCIRKRQAHPQIIATSRHITCGGYDLEEVTWDGTVLTVKSKAVTGDTHVLYITEPSRLCPKERLMRRGGNPKNQKKEGIKTNLYPLQEKWIYLQEICARKSPLKNGFCTLNRGSKSRFLPYGCNRLFHFNKSGRSDPLLQKTNEPGSRTSRLAKVSQISCAANHSSSQWYWLLKKSKASQ